ncbi:hypothetical protein X777_13081, partial [Ooceraea biroi]
GFTVVAKIRLKVLVFCGSCFHTTATEAGRLCIEADWIRIWKKGRRGGPTQFAWHKPPSVLEIQFKEAYYTYGVFLDIMTLTSLDSRRNMRIQIVGDDLLNTD